jgi:hypothetical protein
MQTSVMPGGEGQPTNFVTRWWRRLKKRQDNLNELAACDIEDLARDVGITRSELHILAGRWPDESNLLSRRLGVIGLEQFAQTEPQVVRDLQRVCGQCDIGSRCERDLDDPNDRSWREYCPNVTTLDALRSEERDQRLLRRRKWRAF